MPMTALFEGKIVDATDCPSEVWARMYGQRPRAVIECRECGGRMHSKFSVYKLPFFAHDGAGQCEGSGESDDHVRLKMVLARYIRDFAWVANVEATPGPADSGNWRADVLAVDPKSQRRVAFEVQLSLMSVDDGEMRTERYRRDNIETIWVSLQKSAWSQRIPCIRVRPQGRGVRNHAWAVADGFRRFKGGRWVSSEVRLERLVQGVLQRTLIPHTQSYAPRGGGGVFIVPVKDVESAKTWSLEYLDAGSRISAATLEARLKGLKVRNAAIGAIRDDWDVRLASVRAKSKLADRNDDDQSLIFQSAERDHDVSP